MTDAHRAARGDSAAMKRSLRLGVISLAAGIVSCGTDAEPPAMNVPVGSECTALSQCGAGQQNFRTVEFCDHCFARADSHVCEAGSCRAIDSTGGIKVSFVVPSAARGARSFTVAAINPLKADGTKLTCATLLAATDYKDNPAFNTVGASAKSFPQGGMADPALSYSSFFPADVGADRLVVLRVVTDAQGKGTVKAQGCAAGISVTASATTDVPLTLDPL